MLTKVGTSATNGQGGFASVNSSAPYDLTDCDTFSVQIYGGPWVGTIQFEGSLDRSNWFPITMHSINGTISPSTTTNVNGIFFKPSSPALLSCRINMTAYTSGSLSFLIVGHRMRHVDYTDFWSTAMPFTRDAVFAIDASRSSVGETVVVNAGSGGTALNATLGSTGGADSNDPLLLPWTGENYLYLPGVSANYVSAPSIAAYNIAGDIEIVCRVALDDWTPTAAQVFVSKINFGIQSSYRFLITTAGMLQFDYTPTSDWAVAVNKIATVAVPFADGTAGWVKVTFAATTGVASFYSSTDGVSFTLLSATSATGATSIGASTTDLSIASSGSGSGNISGKFYRAIIRNGIGGTTVFDANFTTGITSGAQTTFTESSSNAATVTINRGTAGRKSVAVTRPVWLFGTDDYMTVPDNALLNFNATDSFTLLVVVRQWNTPVLTGRYMAKGLSSGARWGLLNNAAGVTGLSMLNDGVNAGNAGTAAYTAGTPIVLAMSLDRGTNINTTYTSGVASATAATGAVGTLTNTQPLGIGANGDGTTFEDFELVAVAVWRRALSATEIATINTYYGLVA